MNEMTIEVSEYVFQQLKLEAEKRGVDMNAVILSFFETRCNAPFEAVEEARP